MTVISYIFDDIFIKLNINKMKKIIYILTVLVIVSCSNEPKDYVTLSGKITDKSSDSVVVRTRTYSKTIAVNEDGTFSDTLKVEAEFTIFMMEMNQLQSSLKMDLISILL